MKKWRCCYFCLILTCLVITACNFDSFSQVETQVNQVEPPPDIVLDLDLTTLTPEVLQSTQYYMIYNVMPGDSLQGIADTFGVSINDLLLINHLTLDAEVSAGQKIKIPGSQAAAPIQACDSAVFIGDVTIPDGVFVLPGQGFTKTWRLQNVGTCTWNTGYRLAIARPPQIDGPSSVPLTFQPIAPGQTVDVSIELAAPQAAGQYTNYYALLNDSGEVFGGQGLLNLMAVIQIEGSVDMNTTLAPTQPPVIASATHPATAVPPTTLQPPATQEPTKYYSAPTATSPSSSQINPTTVPPVDENQPTPVGELDSDSDGIPNRIEDWLAKTFMPTFIFDEEEKNPETTRWIYQVTSIFENGKPRWVAFIITSLSQIDYAPVDFPWGEEDVFWHYGDSEAIRMFFRWRPPLNPVSYYDGEYILEHITIRRHSHPYEYDPVTFGYNQDTHPYISISDGKHAMFPSPAECERSDIEDLIPFLDSDWLREDCGGGLWVFPAWDGYNVGERDHPYFNNTNEHFDLSNSFPGEKIWEPAYPFCGGHDVGDMRWAKRQIKLDFFLFQKDLGKAWGYCAGDVEGKWYYVDGNREIDFWPH